MWRGSALATVQVSEPCGLRALVGDALLGAAHGCDRRIGDRQQHDLHEGLPQEPNNDVVDKRAGGIDADHARGDGAEQQRVREFADDGGADQARPEAVGAEAVFHLLQHPRVEQLAHHVAGERGRDDARQQAQDCGEGVLHVVEVRRGQPDGDVERHHGKHGDEKAGEHGAACGFEPVDFGDDVPDDIGDGEEEEGPVGD